jgi:hypothetical protein
MKKLRPHTLMCRTIACSAILAVLGVSQAYAEDRVRPAGNQSPVSTPSSERPLGMAERRPLNPREWPFIGAAEHSGRLSLGRTQAPVAARTRLQRHGRAYRQAQRITAAVALGILGSLVGGLAGAGIGGIGSEEAVLPGFAAGMCVGGAAGVTAGVLLVR